MVRRSLGRLNYDEAFLGVLESSSIQSSDTRFEASQFSLAMFEHETNMHEMLMGGEQLDSIPSKGFTSCRTTGGEILVAFWPKHDLRSNLMVPILKLFLGGACPQTHLAC